MNWTRVKCFFGFHKWLTVFNGSRGHEHCMYCKAERWPL